MKINNENDARTEKKTKDLGTFVILNQKSILDYMEEVLGKFAKDPGYRERVLKQTLPERKYKNTKKSQDYKAISRILKDEMGIQGAGETTIWRLLQIREKSPELYEKIRENKISIRNAYSKLTGEEEKEKKQKENKKQQELTSRGRLDFDKLLEELEYVNAELDLAGDDERRQPSLKKLKRIDTELFKARKKIGSMIADNDPEKFI